MLTQTGQLKKHLKTKSRILYAVALILFLISLLIWYPLFLIGCMIASLVAFFGWQASMKSDYLPADEPETGPRPIVNISQYSLSDKQRRT